MIQKNKLEFNYSIANGVEVNESAKNLVEDLPSNKKPLPIRKRFLQARYVWRGRRDLNSRSSA